MYQWYANAEVCYVYLSDVGPLSALLEPKRFAAARWFTRGWCLQELIAPEHVEFYAKDWTELGTKTSLVSQLAAITSIPAGVLIHEKRPSQYCVAARMSWASRRNTTRVEDMAYCLLGLFDINMPLLYGEGWRAFTRLQEEILKHDDDLTLFLWCEAAPSTYHYSGLLSASLTTSPPKVS